MNQVIRSVGEVKREEAERRLVVRVMRVKEVDECSKDGEGWIVYMVRLVGDAGEVSEV